MGAAAWLEDSEVAVAPGVESEVELRVRNTGSVLDEFSFSPIGMAQGWISVEPASVSLFPGAEEEVRIHFRPPRLHTTLAGASPFAVKVVPREDPESTAVVEGTLVVAPFEERSVDLVPSTSRGRRAGTHGLIVHNTGNAPLVLQLAGTDEKNQLAFDFNPATLNIEPGTAQHTQVRIRPRPRFWRGDPKTWPFHLVLIEEEKEPQFVPGAMLQEPFLPPWLGKAVAGVVAAVLVFIAFWFLLAKPARRRAERAGSYPDGTRGGRDHLAPHHGQGCAASASVHHHHDHQPARRSRELPAVAVEPHILRADGSDAVPDRHHVAEPGQQHRAHHDRRRQPAHLRLGPRFLPGPPEPLRGADRGAGRVEPDDHGGVHRPAGGPVHGRRHVRRVPEGGLMS